MLIKSILSTDPTVLYNLKVYVGKRKYDVRSLTHEQLLKKNIRVKFRKSLLSKHPDLMVMLSVMRSNLEIEIGHFQPNIQSFECDKIRLYRVMKGKIPIGTIEISGNVSYPKKIHTEVSIDEDDAN